MATIWYPSDAAAVETAQWVCDEEHSSQARGASALMTAWLGTELARNGFVAVAVAVNHPGNNAVDGYTVQGVHAGMGAGGGSQPGAGWDAGG
jgi:hypothetical protein